MLVLIVEDNREEREALADELRNRGHDVIEAQDTIEAIRAMEVRPDLAIVDIVLPGNEFYCPDGLTFIRKIRKEGHKLPVIVLSATAIPAVRVVALNGGADDFVVKPHYMDEIMARIDAISRRCLDQQDKHEGMLLDVDNHMLRINGAIVPLTAKEFKLFSILYSKQNLILSRETLTQRVWPNSFEVSPRLIDNHITSLRRKLREVFPDGRDLITTVHGVGYKLDGSKVPKSR
jgi:DNA-binding response OmpR family regulator